MSETQKQLLMDINNISYLLDEDAVQKVKKLALSLLDAKLLKVMPKLTQKQLKELDTTEKIMLLEEYSLRNTKLELKRKLRNLLISKIKFNKLDSTKPFLTCHKAMSNN